MQDGHEFPDLERDIEEVMVRSILTSTAVFQFPEGEVPTLEIRAFTLDGVEHHLLLPIPAALPLLQAIMLLCFAAIGAPDEFSSGTVPDNPDDINWHGDIHE